VPRRIIVDHEIFAHVRAAHGHLLEVQDRLKECCDRIIVAVCKSQLRPAPYHSRVHAVSVSGRHRVRTCIG
jgi:hypothetical protein